MRHPMPKFSYESAPSSTKRGKIPRLPVGTGFIWSAVIPAKAGIYSANLRKCAVDCGVYSRSPAFAEDKLRGNDRRFERHPVPNDATTQDVGTGVGMKERDFSKFGERRGNVYENKGPAFHDPQ